MASFEPAVDLVLRHEGGFVNNPNDPGGATNFGITQRVLAEFLKRGATVDDVKKMSVETAKQIYQSRYWIPLAGNAYVSQDVANWVLDMGVLRGPVAAAQSLQQAVGVAADGQIGYKTVTAVQQANPATLLNIFRSLCIKKFAAIVTARPASLEFLNGWVKRAEEMTDTVSLLEQKTSAPSA